MNSSRFELFRRGFLIETVQLQSLLDLGLGMLDDATVQTVALVCGTGKRSAAPCLFVDLTADDKGHQERFLETIKPAQLGQKAQNVFVVEPEDLASLPKATLAYGTSKALLTVFRQLTPLDPAFAEVYAGLQTGRDAQYLRLRWEIPMQAQPERWLSFVKGGDYCKYYQDPDLLIDWTQPAQQQYMTQTVRPVILSKNRHKYIFRPGLTYRPW